MELAWEEVAENGVWTTKGWRASPLSASDPPQFTTKDYGKFRHPRDIPLPQSDSSFQWVWCGDWCYTKWKFCKKWDRDISHWSFAKSKSARCRRRIWKRPRIRNSDETHQQSIREVVYENQRSLVKKWASPYLPRDTPHWSDANGNFKTQGVVNNNLPLNWKWIDDEWNIDIIENETNDSGWQYAADFNAVNWSPKRTILHTVRRRKYTRVRMRMKQENTVETRLIRTVSESSAIKKKSVESAGIISTNGDDFDGTLVVSYTNQFTLAWSTHGVIESSGYQCSIWQPKLGPNEFCLGHLLSAERAYPTKSFLVIIKKNGSDPDAFRRPTGLTLVWSTRFHDATALEYGYFYKPVAPSGYVALGDVAIKKEKGATVTVQDFPKLVCVKKEFVDRYAETADKYSKITCSLVQPHTMIWNTKKLAAKVHCQLWTQPAFSNEVDSPFFVCNKLEKPNNVYPRLNIRYVLQDDPDNITVHANFMIKKGKGVGAQQRKRFFILTSEKQLHYYETNECRKLKGTVDLCKMTDICKVQQSNTERFEIPTQGRKWAFTCNSSQDSIHWVNEINNVWKKPKEVVNKIIAVQIQGQPQDDEDYKHHDSAANTHKDKAMQLFDRPLSEQVVHLLLKNINIIQKALKGDHNIGASVLDEMFKQQSVSPVKNKRSKTHANAGYPGAFKPKSHDITMEETEDNSHKESVYKYLDDAWRAVRLLLKHFNEKKQNQRPPQIVDQMPVLEEESVKYIVDDIIQYVETFGDEPDPMDIIKMCDACALVETFKSGRQNVVEHITDHLMNDVKDKYEAGTEIAGCQHVKQRFEDYRKQIDVYNNVYSFFIPAKWIVPVTFSLQFCKVTGDQLDDHLKKNPEKSQVIMQAKQICIANEERMQREAMAFLSQPHTELDKDEIKSNLPSYDGMISSILDQHLNSYIAVERGKAEECVLSAKNETFGILSEDGSLTELYEGGASKNSAPKHKSCESLLVAIRTGFKKCIQISRGQQLVELLLAHQQYLAQYHDILSDLTREALETNNVILISPATRKIDPRELSSERLTERYLWFNGYYKGIGIQPIPVRDRNREDVIIQRVLTFLVLVYNSSLYCKDSMLNLGRAAHKAIEPMELKKEVDFRPLHTQFESLQFSVSERLSQLICCRIVEDLYDTYKSMNFQAMSEKDYMYLEKCRYLFESTWSNLAIQLLYIMPIAQYKLMVKRCVYLLAEFAFESTLRLRNVDQKIAVILMDNYTHLKASIYKHLAAESQHLASEIEHVANIIFKPLDSVYDLLCTDNIAIPALDEQKTASFDLFESLYSAVVQSSANKEPVFYKKYTLFEMKIVEFYHSSNVVLCFQTLLLQLMESQIKLNRSAKASVKPHFFDAFDFKLYTKPQKADKLKLKERTIKMIMDCKAIDNESQTKLLLLCKEKTTHDMLQEQHDSISEAMKKKSEWEENKLLNDTKQEANPQLSETHPAELNMEIAAVDGDHADADDVDVIIMKQAVSVDQVDNKIVVAIIPQQPLKPKTNKINKALIKSDMKLKTVKTQTVIETDTNILEGNEDIKEDQETMKPKPAPPQKIPNAKPPPIPKARTPSTGSANGAKPRIPMKRPPPKPNSGAKGLLRKLFV